MNFFNSIKEQLNDKKNSRGMRGKVLVDANCLREVIERFEVLENEYRASCCINIGTWYRSECSGLWHENQEACGQIDAIKIDGKLYTKEI